MESLTRIAIAHTSDDVIKQIKANIGQIECRFTKAARTCSELAQICLEERPDLIITGLRLDDGEVIDTLISISADDPLPAVIIAESDSLMDVERALQDHVMAYLVEPLDGDQIEPTVYLVLRRFEQFRTLQLQVRDLQQALADRKVIERAKGIVMASHNIDESAAFRLLQKAASAARQRLVDTANQVIEQQVAT